MDNEERVNVCRVCLTKIETFDQCFYLHEKYENAVSLDTNHQEIITIAEKITACADVKIIEDDGLPDRICSDCLTELENAYNFKRNCEKSDDILRFAFKYGSRTDANKIFKEHTVDELDREHIDFNEPSPSNYDVDIKQEDRESVSSNKSVESVLNEDLGLSFTDVEPADKVLIKSKDPCKLEPTDVPTQELNKLIDQSDRESIDESAFEQDDIQNNLTPSRAIDLKLECDNCGNFFKSKCKLRVHIKRVHPTIFTCSFCNLEFKSYRAHCNHLKNRTKICLQASMMRIEGTGKSTVFHCKQCKYSTTNRSNTIQHFNVHSKASSFSCHLCDKSFTHRNSLKDHQERIHKLCIVPKTCNLCGQAIFGRYNYKQHMRKHRTELFQCDLCQKCFKYKTSLLEHINRHSNIKDHACKQCCSKFYSSSGLWQHKRRYHQQPEKSCCKICGYIKSRRAIKVHEKKHNSNNVACSICGKFLDNDFQLTLHKKRHDERSYQCAYCDKTFFSRKCHINHVGKCKLK